MRNAAHKNRGASVGNHSAMRFTGQLAQLVEQRIENPRPGSIPRLAAKTLKNADPMGRRFSFQRPAFALNGVGRSRADSADNARFRGRRYIRALSAPDHPLHAFSRLA